MEQSDATGGAARRPRKLLALDHGCWLNREARQIARQRGCTLAEAKWILARQIAENRRRNQPKKQSED